MSNIGGEPMPINVSNRLNSDHNGEPLAFTDGHYLARGAVLLSVSIAGLLGNFISLLLVLVVRKLQKPYNSFFIHQCLLDTVKSIYCIVFAKSLFDHKAPADCAILGASYIVFVTTSAFNILAVTINEIYHFTNRIVGVHINNKCCVLFGLGITWFASIIINLGVAFLPGNPTFDSAVGYCTFMYGITGNYLLHVLWIILITFALVLTTVYLRKLWIDIKGRAYYRVATLFHHTLRIQLDENGNAGEKQALYKRNIQKTIRVARKNFFLLVGIVIIFIIFWYPLFLLTIVDIGFKADPVYYRTLTIFAWCHSALTPIFFVLYNLNSFKEMKSTLLHGPKKEEQSGNSGDTVTPDSQTASRSPIRPNTLNVTPAYNCDSHHASGSCHHNSTGTNSHQNGRQKRAMSHDIGNTNEKQKSYRRANTVGSGLGHRPCPLHKPDYLDPTEHEETCPIRRHSVVSAHSTHSCRDKRWKMGSVIGEIASTPEVDSGLPALSSEVVDRLVAENLPPQLITDLIELQQRANQRSMPLLTAIKSKQKDNSVSNVATRSQTMPEHLRHGMDTLEVEVNSELASPSPNLSVHRLSTGCISTPMRLVRSMSDFYIHEYGVDWV